MEIIFYLALLSLFATVTNQLYLSPLIACLPFAAFGIGVIKRFVNLYKWLLLWLAYCLLSTLLYDPGSLLDFDFYRYDGNLFISYLPILSLAALEVKPRKLDAWLKGFLYFSVVLYAALLGSYIAQSGLSVLVNSQASFPGLFKARNAAGGWLSVMCCLALAFVYHGRQAVLTIKRLAFAGVLTLLFCALLMTYSRGSILGFLGGAFCWWLYTKGWHKAIAVFFGALAALTITFLLIGYPTFQAVGAAVDYSESKEEKLANAQMRYYSSWPRAIYLFAHSPVFGLGVGSYDDRPHQLVEIVPYVFSLNAIERKQHGDAHAHHSYLHLLAELGVVGFFLFCRFWYALLTWLRETRKQAGGSVANDFLLLAYFTITTAAFTEHRVTTPSMMLPFTIVLGMYLRNSRRKAQPHSSSYPAN